MIKFDITIRSLRETNLRSYKKNIYIYIYIYLISTSSHKAKYPVGKSLGFKSNILSQFRGTKSDQMR